MADQIRPALEIVVGSEGTLDKAPIVAACCQEPEMAYSQRSDKGIYSTFLSWF